MNLPQRTFGEIATLRNGVNYVVADKGEVAKVVGVGDFQARTELSIFDGLSEVRLRSHLSSDDELRDGDLLFVRSNGNKNLIGRCMVIRNPPEGVTFSGFTIRARLDKTEALPEYISLVFQAGSLSRQMTLAGGGNGNISNLNQSLLASMPVRLPSLEVQKVLVTCASTWDTAIEKTKQLIDAKDKQKTGVMAALLTEKQRLNGFGAPWRHWHLGELFRERVEPNRVDLPLLSITGNEGVVLRADLDRKDTSSEDKSKYLRICPGDIGYNTMRMWQGVSALSRYEGIVSPAYTVCIPGPDIDGRFASYLFKLPAVIHLFYRYSQGLTSDTWNLKFHHFAEIRVRIPEVDEQIAIASVLAAMDEELAILRKQRDALAQQKRGLMQKLLTGQWRVPNTNIEKETCSC